MGYQTSRRGPDQFRECFCFRDVNDLAKVVTSPVCVCATIGRRRRRRRLGYLVYPPTYIFFCPCAALREVADSLETVQKRPTSLFLFYVSTVRFANSASECEREIAKKESDVWLIAASLTFSLGLWVSNVYLVIKKNLSAACLETCV